MENLQQFNNFLSTSNTEIPIISFIFSLLLAAILSLILAWIYVRFGRSLSNRKLFAKNFLLITMTTMLIITIVKSSLALSLGLVGALSIIRFRAAIKEPEELAYLFLAIAIGLGLGANQIAITLVAFLVIVGVLIVVTKFSYKKDDGANLHLVISGENNQEMDLEVIVNLLKNHCQKINLRRFEETPSDFEASFLVEFNNYEQMNQAKKSIQGIDGNVNFSFIDNSNIQ